MNQRDWTRASDLLRPRPAYGAGQVDLEGLLHGYHFFQDENPDKPGEGDQPDDPAFDDPSDDDEPDDG